MIASLIHHRCRPGNAVQKTKIGWTGSHVRHIVSVRRARWQSNASSLHDGAGIAFDTSRA